jgi:hypothetical protein
LLSACLCVVVCGVAFHCGIYRTKNEAQNCSIKER